MILIVLLAGLCSLAEASQPFAPTTVGTVLEYRTDDAKGKVQAYTVSEVKDIAVSGDTTRIIMESAVLDADRKPMMMPQPDGSEVPAVTVSSAMVVGDRMVFAMSEILNSIPGLPEGFSVRTDGTDNVLPLDLEAGEKLPGYAAELTAYMVENGKSTDLLTMKVSGKDGEVLAHETVETPAGKFDAWKVTMTETVSMMMGMVKNTFKSVTWYVPAVGAVRTEQYDQKGKLQSVEVLVSLTVPQN